jgi:hypothetical protein
MKPTPRIRAFSTVIFNEQRERLITMKNLSSWSQFGILLYIPSTQKTQRMHIGTKLGIVLNSVVTKYSHVISQPDQGWASAIYSLSSSRLRRSFHSSSKQPNLSNSHLLFPSSTRFLISFHSSEYHIRACHPTSITASLLPLRVARRDNSLISQATRHQSSESASHPIHRCSNTDRLAIDLFLP